MPSGSGRSHERNLYGRRRGHRLRKGRQALVDVLLPRLAIALPGPAEGDWDPGALFAAPTRDLWLEIGFGAGEHLAWQARTHADIGFIGCEPYLNGIAALVHLVNALEIDNVRVFTDDARLLLRALPAACLGRVFLLFPDPWPKRRHHKRRFIQDAELDALARVMKDGAEFRIATDHDGFGRWALARLRENDSFVWLARRAADWRTRPEDWPETRYQRKARAEGRSCVFLRYRRRCR